MTATPKDIGASVRARLLRLARGRGDDFQLVLTRYANERFLYRLAESAHRNDFILKGATLFMLWSGQPHRATRDVDLLGFGDPSPEWVRAVFMEVLAQDVVADGLQFDLDTLSVNPIRDRQEYGGVRAVVVARITYTTIRLQVDVGFGDAVTPRPIEVEFPALLDFPPPRVRAYPRETVVAEKVEAAVNLGMANSRMKDFHDLVVLSRDLAFDGPVLVDAMRATFERRGTPVPEQPPVAFTGDFWMDPAKQTQWNAFLRKARAEPSMALAVAIQEIAAFVSEPLLKLGGGMFDKRWSPGGPWG